MSPLRRYLVFTCATLVLVAACSSSPPDATTESAPHTTSTPETTGLSETTLVSDQATFPAERCEANRAAGPISFLTGFDFAAAASIIDVVVAKAHGYYEALCLDVMINPSTTIDNYPIVGSGAAQFSSGGSFAEVAVAKQQTGSDFRVIGVAAHAPIDVLLTKPDRVTDLADIEGATIGVHGATPQPIAALLADAGVEPGTYDAAPLTGFDSVANFGNDEFAAITGYLSNEPGRLAASGVEFEQHSAVDAGIPGSFGVYYTSGAFADEHPTAVADFMRATLRGLNEALDDPETAVRVALSQAEATGNPFFLDDDTESFRWAAEAELIRSEQVDGLPLGAPSVELLQEELDLYAPLGLFDGAAPSAESLVEPSIVPDLYLDGVLHWPASQTTSQVERSEDPYTVATGAAFPSERCDTNRDAGTISFLTGFGFAAAASILEVITAEVNGYYDELCLDVELVPSFSTSNYPLVAAGRAQFASGGSFSETASFSLATDADLRVVYVAGAKSIDTLLIKPEVGSELTDLAGTTIGVKGKLPPSIEVMLADVGLSLGTDYETVPVEGYDPVAHMSFDATVGVPGWRSNEPGRLEAAGVEFVQFDAADAGVPGSFGVIFTSQQFLDEHPQAAEDFVRATLRGLQTSLADPDQAALAAIEMIEANGNPNFLSPDTERFRAVTEADIIRTSVPADVVPGSPIVDLLQAEIDAFEQTGLFGTDEPPSAEELVADELVAAVTAPDGIIWPTTP